MPTVPLVPTYPFDPTGTLASNKIVGEQQILTAANFRDFHFLVPKLGPYFATSLQVILRATDNSLRFLNPGVDYFYTHKFHDASLACGKPIYGSISFLDLTLTGVITLEYQNLGGEWVIDENKVAEILADRLHNPRITAWEQVTDLPHTFPVIDHQWNLTDMVGMTAVVEQLVSLEDAVRSQQLSGLAAHKNDLNNPHGVTAEQIDVFTKAETNTMIASAVAVVKQEMQATLTQALATVNVSDVAADEQFFMGA